jgi:hypothetical protein
MMKYKGVSNNSTIATKNSMMKLPMVMDQNPYFARWLNEQNLDKLSDAYIIEMIHGSIFDDGWVDELPARP